MSISSIHIASGKAGYLSHNDRSLSTKNTIFNDEKNEVSLDNKQAFKLYRQELKIRSEAYSKRTKQSLQKNSITHLSAIINLNHNHKLEDLKPLVDYLENEFDTKVFQVAIHRDEGHIKDGKNIKNYHAHIEFLGLDSDGASVRKKLTKKTLSQLQTKTAEILEMERGINYAQSKTERPHRLDTYDFKAHKEREEKSINTELAKQKDLKELIARLRADLKEKNAERKEYAELEQLNRDLKARIKNKDLTVTNLETKIKELNKRIKELGDNYIKLKSFTDAFSKENKELKDELILHTQNDKKVVTDYNQLKEDFTKVKARLEDREFSTKAMVKLHQKKVQDLEEELEEVRRVASSDAEQLYQIDNATGIDEFPSQLQFKLQELVNKEVEKALKEQEAKPSEPTDKYKELYEEVKSSNTILQGMYDKSKEKVVKLQEENQALKVGSTNQTPKVRSMWD